MADKSEAAPYTPLATMPNREARFHNLAVDLVLVRSGEIESTSTIGIPWPMSFTILDEADKSDPENQLRVFSFGIGKELCYKATFYAKGFAREKDIVSISAMAFITLALEHAPEI